MPPEAKVKSPYRLVPLTRVASIALPLEQLMLLTWELEPKVICAPPVFVTVKSITFALVAPVGPNR